ncbi:alpha/beta hydrolase [Mesobacillus foraminis]|uniref:alpha/beta hydrolase n=1 Tax=Mesobacillus foraminis TaxID=279826 RepID=UPI0015D5FAB7|nr:alpha/beta hydrolase-fold protein [Mesobacillus foraminis]
MSFPRGTLNELKLHSNALEEEMTLLVYQPAAFSPLNKYTIMIAQDGRDYFQLGRIGRVADELLAAKKIENLMIIGIPYHSVEDRWKKYHPDGEQNEAYIRFLAHELVPFIDRTFPTLQVGMGRALIGDSLGATVSLRTALRYPHTFSKVILQSPYVNEKVLQETRDFPEGPQLDIYHTVGSKETAVKTTKEGIQDFLTPNRELSRILETKTISYHYGEFEGGHFWTHWQPDIKEALQKIL